MAVPWIGKYGVIHVDDSFHCVTLRVTHLMKTTNIRELKHATSVVLGWVAEGESVEITRRDQVVGIIVPPIPVEANPGEKPTPPEDFYQRLESLFHDKRRAMTGTELVSYARGER